MESSNPIPAWLRAPRNFLWLVIAAMLLALIALVSPVQLPVVLYKAALVSVAAVLAYWIDRALFPYARPDSYLHRDWRTRIVSADGEVDYPVVQAYIRVFGAAMIRRAIVFAAVALAMAMGL